MQRFLALTLGLALVAVSLYVLARDRSDEPLGRIGSDSRANLERVLADSDAEDGRR